MSKEVKPVAVIILNWNGERLLKQFLPSVVRHTPRGIADVIVADNGSTDGSLEVLHRDFPDIKLLEFDRNHGFAAGYNLAIERTRYRYTVLLNSDVEVRSDWLTPLYEAMEADPHLGACQPKILSYTEPDKFEYAGAAGGFLDRFGYPYCRGRILSEVEADHGQYDTPVSVFWATGAALMVRSDLYLEVGGLDPEFFAHMEEIDLCWRIRLAGYDIKAIPDGAVYHLGGGSLPASNPRKTYLNFRNNLLMLHKNLPEGRRGPLLFKRRLIDTLAWAKFVATLDFANASAVVQAHRDFSRMRRRYTVHPQTDILRATPNKDINLLTTYYLGRKHTYDRL